MLLWQHRVDVNSVRRLVSLSHGCRRLRWSLGFGNEHGRNMLSMRKEAVVAGLKASSPKFEGIALMLVNIHALSARVRASSPLAGDGQMTTIAEGKAGDFET